MQPRSFCGSETCKWTRWLQNVLICGDYVCKLADWYRDRQNLFQLSDLQDDTLTPIPVNSSDGVCDVGEKLGIDNEEAAKIFLQLSAMQGNPEACFALWEMLGKEGEEALTYLWEAASRQHEEASVILRTFEETSQKQQVGTSFGT